MNDWFTSLWSEAYDAVVFDELDTIDTQSNAMSDAARIIFGGLQGTRPIKTNVYYKDYYKEIYKYHCKEIDTSLEFEDMSAFKEFIEKYPKHMQYKNHPLLIHLRKERKSYYVTVKR